MAKAKSTCDVCHEIRPRDEMVNIGKTKYSASTGVGKRNRGTTRIYGRTVNRWVCKDTCVPLSHSVGNFLVWFFMIVCFGVAGLALLLGN